MAVGCVAKKKKKICIVAGGLGKDLRQECIAIHCTVL